MIRTRAAVVSMIVFTLALATSATRAQLGPLGPPTCQATIGVLEPRYVGKQSGQDSVEVSWNVPVAASAGGLPGLGGHPAVACAAQESFSGKYVVGLTVERRLGHRDSASATVNGALGALQRNIQVPRAAIETDPRKYEVKVDATVLGFFTISAKATGSGAPAVAGAVLSSSSSLPTLSAQCTPTFAVTALALTAPDTVTVSWSSPPLSSLCLKQTQAGVQVKLVRADGTSVFRSASPPIGTTSAQVSLGAPAGQVASFEVTVSMGVSSSLTLRGDAAGDF
jgi:hypothetical protein